MVSIDLDNATYTTGAVQPIKKKDQQKAIFWATVLEFIGRIILVIVFLALTVEEKPLFTIFGFDFTVENISLFAAGTFLLFRNTRELYQFLRGKGMHHEPHLHPTSHLSKVILEMGLVLTIMSIDTVLAGLGVATGLANLFFLFLVSAVIRLLFVRQLAAFIQKYPALNIIIFTFLVIIGLELILQGFGIDHEPAFNAILLISLIAAAIYHRRLGKKQEYKS